MANRPAIGACKERFSRLDRTASRSAARSPFEHSARLRVGRRHAFRKFAARKYEASARECLRTPWNPFQWHERCTPTSLEVSVMQAMRNFSRVLSIAGFGCAVIGGSLSCTVVDKAPEQKMASSGAVHGGRGTVVAKEGDSGNTDLEVKVEHLADPEKVARNASTYI